MSSKIFLIGASGKMGLAIQELCEPPKSSMAVVATMNSKGYQQKELPQVAIDFSLPEARDSVLNKCIELKIPLVSGVTGYGAADLEALKQASQKIPIFWAPNMSTGVALLNTLIRGLALLKDDFDFQIEEFHHRHKVDSPSGTALFLQKTLVETVGEVPEPVAVRGGGIFGVHSIYAMAEEEVIELKHTALKRSVFAKGALRVAEWIKDRKSGLYSMEDYIGY